MKDRVIRIALLVATGVLTYLCALEAGFLPIDDVGMVNSVSSKTFTIGSLFFSGANEYYRPLAVVFYAANAAATGLDPFFFHLFNVALHIANALLVYWLGCVLLGERRGNGLAPLLAALCFLVHPINSEAVVWVSARPDLLCTFFFLLALILMVKHEEKGSPLTFFCVGAAYLASLCSKEASIALLGIAPLYLLFRARRESLKTPLLLTVTVLATTALYAFLRMGPAAALDRGLGSVLKGVGSAAQGGAGEAQALAGALQGGAGALQGAAAGQEAWAGSLFRLLLDGLAAYGFYLQKLFVPFPLNFTIMRFDRPVAFFALAFSLVGAFWLLRRHRNTFLPLLIVFVGIGPAILAYIGNIPWTPFGERYLYLPMVGFSLLAGMGLSSIPRLPRVAPVVLLLLLAIPTIDRVSLWCDGTAFWNDALRKSPGFGKSYSSLGVIAYGEGRYNDAERHFRDALAHGYGGELVMKNLASVYAATGDWRNYESAMLEAASLSPRPTGTYLELINTIMQKGSGDASSLNKKAIKYHLLALAKDPEYQEAHYNIGKLYLAEGDLENARRHLSLYAEKSVNGDYRPYALRMIARISGAEGTPASPAATGGRP